MDGPTLLFQSHGRLKHQRQYQDQNDVVDYNQLTPRQLYSVRSPNTRERQECLLVEDKNHPHLCI